MSLSNRVAYFVRSVFKSQPHGITWEEICEQVADMEYPKEGKKKRIKRKVGGEVAKGMGMKMRPQVDWYDHERVKEDGRERLERYFEDGSYGNYITKSLVHWNLGDGVYTLSGNPDLDSFDPEFVERVKEDGLDEWVAPNMGPDSTVTSVIKSILSQNPEGLSFEELLSSLKGFYFNFKWIVSGVPEGHFLGSMGFAYRPVEDWYFRDQFEDKKELLDDMRFSPRFLNWAYDDRRYYHFKREGIPEIPDTSLRTAIRMTLAGQLGGHASQRGLTNAEYLRQFATLMANIKGTMPQE